MVVTEPGRPRMPEGSGKGENMEILYEDEHLIVVWKPPGLESQSSRGLGADMVSELRRHIHNLSPDQGVPYVGVIHRLDKPVSGIMVYAREKNSAGALSRQVSEGQMDKRYLAVLCGKVDKNVDKFVDFLLKDEKRNLSRIVDKGITGARCAKLEYRVLKSIETETRETLTLAEIHLLTGRHHQIRVQMSGHGLPLWGDRKYNPDFVEMKERTEPVALSAYRLSFCHPVTGRVMKFCRMPENGIFRRFDFVEGAFSQDDIYQVQGDDY